MVRGAACQHLGQPVCVIDMAGAGELANESGQLRTRKAHRRFGQFQILGEYFMQQFCIRAALVRQRENQRGCLVKIFAGRVSAGQAVVAGKQRRVFAVGFANHA